MVKRLFDSIRTVGFGEVEDVIVLLRLRSLNFFPASSAVASANSCRQEQPTLRMATIGTGNLF